MTSSSEHSAGGIVIRELDGRTDVAVIHPRHRNVTALPKGHIDPGEDAQTAATREVLEETGLTVELISPLDDVKYVYQFRGRTIFKKVTFFLFRYVSGEIDQITEPMRKEVDKAKWIPLERATKELTYPGEREMAKKAVAFLKAQPPK